MCNVKILENVPSDGGGEEVTEVLPEDKGFVYVLVNDSYNPSVTKVGLTRRSPDVRRREIYQGSTGVPEHFDVAVAFNVGNCVRAEEISHQRLDVYRVNPKREFFRLPISIVASIVQETCVSVNKAMGMEAPDVLKFVPTKKTSGLRKVSNPMNIDWESVETVAVPLSQLKKAPVGTSQLTSALIDRMRIVHAVFREVNDVSLIQTIENFSRDAHPEVELEVWENMVRVYIELDAQFGLTHVQKQEAFKLILFRSMEREAAVRSQFSCTSLSKAAAEYVYKRFREG